MFIVARIAVCPVVLEYSDILSSDFIQHYCPTLSLWSLLICSGNVCFISSCAVLSVGSYL